MNTKEIKITPPEGFEIDKENSTLECIKFKPIEKKRWRDNKDANVRGYYIDPISIIKYSSGYKDYKNTASNYNLFATEKLAKSALAMAHISQIMANDERFGGVITDKEWNDNSDKFIIYRYRDEIGTDQYCSTNAFLAFHTPEQRDLFLEENEDLVKDYLML